MYCARCGTWVPAGEAACGRCGMEQVPQPPAPALAAEPLEGVTAAAVAAPAIVRYGGFWRRFASATVDGLILFFPDAILRVLAGLPSPLSLRALSEDQTGRSLGISLVMTLVWWWYCSRLESSRWQGTLGQQLLGMRVTDLSGRRISFLRATGRFFAQWLSVLLCGFGYLFNLWTSRRQTLHDLVAGCTLVRPEPVVHAATPPSPSFAEPSS
jgi:uncharacterized RDD family membrane protein YckC